MGSLPRIDDHARTVGATQDRAFSALLAAVSRSIGRPLPRALVSIWGLDPPERRGDWSRPEVGTSVPGFVVAELDPPRLLVLRGEHHFSRYELRFTVQPDALDRVEVRAASSGEFPGPLGAVYRALVIGSRGHVLAVRRLLAGVADRAERSG